MGIGNRQPNVRTYATHEKENIAVNFNCSLCLFVMHKKLHAHKQEQDSEQRTIIMKQTGPARLQMNRSAGFIQQLWQIKLHKYTHIKKVSNQDMSHSYNQ